MKKLKQESGEDLFSLLTLDTIGDILSRLDVKTLSRSKCVSRAMHDLISGPHFFNIHCQRSMKNIKFLYCSYHVSPINEVLSFYSISGQRHRCSKLSCFTLMYDQVPCPITCDLVCFTRGNNIYLCNPSTNELRVLPKPSTGLCYSRLGFGYSAQVREYKVVRLFPYSSASHKRSKTEGGTKIKGMQCEILTISDHTKVDSCSWKRLRCPRSVYPRTMSTNGRIYWLIDHKAPLYNLKTEELILSFDIANDTFSTLPRPSSWPLEKYKNSLEFMVMDGKLCIADKRSMPKSAVLDIWILVENCFWTKVYSINILEYSHNVTTLSARIIRSLHPKCMIGGEIVFQSHLMEGTFSCNIESKTIYKIATPHSCLGIFWESSFSLK